MKINIKKMSLCLGIVALCGACGGDDITRRDRYLWSFEPRLALESFRLTPCPEQKPCQIVEARIHVDRSDPKDQSPYTIEWQLPPSHQVTQSKWNKPDTFLISAELQTGDMTFHDEIQSLITLKRGSRDIAFQFNFSPLSKSEPLLIKANEKKMVAHQTREWPIQFKNISVRTLRIRPLSATEEAWDLHFSVEQTQLPGAYPLEMQVIFPTEGQVFSTLVADDGSLHFEIPLIRSRYESPDSTMLALQIKPQFGASLLLRLILSTIGREEPRVSAVEMTPLAQYDRSTLNHAQQHAITDLTLEKYEWSVTDDLHIYLRQYYENAEKGAPLSQIRFRLRWARGAGSMRSEIISSDSTGRLRVPHLTDPSAEVLGLRIDALDLRRSRPLFLIVDPANRSILEDKHGTIAKKFPPLLE